MNKPIIYFILFSLNFLFFLQKCFGQTTIFYEDFESSFPNSWIIGNDGGVTTHRWGLNNFRKYMGSYSAFCAFNGNLSNNSYPDNLITYMDKRNLNFTNYSSIKLSFYYWINTESNYDKFYVYIRTQNGQWFELWNASGNQSNLGWQYKEINLDNFIGQTNVIIQFKFVSDQSITPTPPSGVWIDNISCIGYTSNNLRVYVRNQNGSLVTGATVRRYTSNWVYIDEGTTGSDGSLYWPNIPSGVYNLEVYYRSRNLPFDENEFWGSGSATVTSGSTTTITLQRVEPYTTDIKLKNNSTGEELSPSSPIPPGTSIRAEVTVKNLSSSSKTVKVRVVFSRSQSSSSNFDCDLTSSEQVVSGNGGTRVFSFVVCSPMNEGLYYRGNKTLTIINSNYISTDTWAWGPSGGAFRVKIPGSIKIIGVIQNSHNNPQSSYGLTIVAKIPTDNQVSECKLYWDNLDDICPEGSPVNLTHIGNNFYKININNAFPWICEFFPGNRIRWRIMAKDDQNNLYFYPTYNAGNLLYDTTQIFNYSQMNPTTKINNNPRGLVNIIINNENNITVQNHKAFYLSFIKDSDTITYSSDNPLLPNTILSAKTFPFGFLSPPSKNFYGFNLLNDNSQVNIIFSKWGQNYDALIYTMMDLIIALVGIDNNLIPSNSKAGILVRLYPIFRNVIMSTIGNISNFDTLPIFEKISILLFKIADDIMKKPGYYIQIITTSLEPILGQTAANSIANILVNSMSPIATISKTLTIANILATVSDFITSPDRDTIYVKRTRGHFVEISPISLPGMTSPINVGSNVNFAFRIKNISNQKLYNLWFGLDIYAWNNSLKRFVKVENTKTDYPDPETGRIGLIDFGNNQGRDLGPNETIIFTSNNYNFSNSVTGFQYQSLNQPYKYVFTVWSNGQPGQTFPVEPVNLTKDFLNVPFFIKDNIPPSQPNLYLVDTLETDSISYLAWSLNPNDLDIVRILVSQNGIVTDTIDNLLCNIKGFLKTNLSKTIRVKAIDVGGFQSEWSNSIQINPIVKVESANLIPVKFELYQNYPNPFNPYTNIDYDVPVKSHIKLVLIDVLGRVLKVLVDKEEDAGKKSVILNASELSSGIYFYKIISTDLTNNRIIFSKSKKLTIIK